MKPNTTLIRAPISDAPSVSRYDANTRGSATACQNFSHGMAAVRKKSDDSGTRTIRLRYSRLYPSVSPKPGKTLCCLKGIFTLLARLIDLIEHAAIVELLGLSRGPAAKTLLDREQFQLGELLALFRRDELADGGAVVVLRGKLLTLRRVKVFQVRLGDGRRAALFGNLIHDGHRRLGENADARHHNLELPGS